MLLCKLAEHYFTYSNINLLMSGGGRESRRGGRRGGHQDREEDAYCRPSAPATLFDFVTSKMPSSSQGSPWILSVTFFVFLGLRWRSRLAQWHVH